MAASTEQADSPLVAVVTINWNGIDDTRACVRSLLAQTWPSVQIHVVDNGSSGGEAAALAAEFGEQIVLYESAENLGFTGGNNLAMRAVLEAGAAEFVALLNNDAEAEPDWIERLVVGARGVPTAGLFASHMVFHNAPEVTENTGTDLLTTGDAVPRGRGRPRSEFAADGAVPVLGACAGAVLYRAATLRQIGLFRDDFFANFEDVDLSLRAAAMGVHSVFVPGAVVRHKLNASIVKVRDDAFRVRSVRNLTLAYWLNMPWLVVGLNLPGLLVTYFLVPPLALLCGQWDLCRILVGGRWLALRSFGRVRTERRRLAPLRAGSAWRIWRLQRSFLATYWQYFVDVVIRRRRRYME